LFRAIKTCAASSTAPRTHVAAPEGISATVNWVIAKADRVGENPFGVFKAKRTPPKYASGFQLSAVTPYVQAVFPEAESIPYRNPADMKRTESLSA